MNKQYLDVYDGCHNAEFLSTVFGVANVADFELDFKYYSRQNYAQRYTFCYNRSLLWNKNTKMI